jgi:Dolichyl-phosphate-mannose-protein mannosyltransferase
MRALEGKRRAAAVAARLRHPLAIVLLAGLALRIVAMLGYQPALVFTDTEQYVASAADLGEAFAADTPLRPYGYAIFLAGVAEISPTLTAVVVVQHLLGLATAALLYATVLRLGGPRWAAVASAAVVALVPDFVYFEHALLAEAPFLFLITAAVYATARGTQESSLDRGSRSWVAWLAAAGVLIAVAATFRAVGQALVPLVVVFAAIGVRGDIARRLGGAAAAALAAVVVLLGYGGAMSASGGYFGLAAGDGWAVYVRTAPIADCARFDPPAGTEGLCERTPPDSRPGPDFYAWNPESPARQLFVGPPLNDEVVGSFGREALEQQPLDYLGLVVTDLARFVDADAGVDRPDGGHPLASYRFGRYDIGTIDEGEVASFYGPYQFDTSALADALGDVQQIVRVHGVLIALAAVLALAGLIRGPRQVRVAILTLAAPALTLLVAAAALATYDGRFGVPAMPALIAAGLLGAWSLAPETSAARNLRPLVSRPRGWLASRLSRPQ